jgi:hypothetical protein
MMQGEQETGVAKNACYALSCLCTTLHGFRICLQLRDVFHLMLQAIEDILIHADRETVWFGLM